MRCKAACPLPGEGTPPAPVSQGHALWAGSAARLSLDSQRPAAVFVGKGAPRKGPAGNSVAHRIKSHGETRIMKPCAGLNYCFGQVIMK